MSTVGAAFPRLRHFLLSFLQTAHEIIPHRPHAPKHTRNLSHEMKEIPRLDEQKSNNQDKDYLSYSDSAHRLFRRSNHAFLSRCSSVEDEQR